MATLDLDQIGMLTQSRIIYGVDLTPEEMRKLDKWQREADGWTIELCSTNTTEQQPGIWPAFHFWKGPGHHGEPPTVSDLIHSVASDCNYLASEPDQLTYEVGKRIEHNERKMRKLFGHQLWERIKAYSEEEIEEAFGPFS